MLVYSLALQIIFKMQNTFLMEEWDKHHLALASHLGVVSCVMVMEIYFIMRLRIICILHIAYVKCKFSLKTNPINDEISMYYLTDCKICTIVENILKCSFYV
jgi:hypothetical protein